MIKIILVSIVVCLAALIAIPIIRSSIQRYGHGQFERGAWAVLQHHKAYGNYGSMYYRDRVFYSNNDPQDSGDVAEFIKPAESNCGSAGNSKQHAK